jgi:hypothetical protein
MFGLFGWAGAGRPAGWLEETVQGLGRCGATDSAATQPEAYPPDGLFSLTTRGRRLVWLMISARSSCGGHGSGRQRGSISSGARLAGRAATAQDPPQQQGGVGRRRTPSTHTRCQDACHWLLGECRATGGFREGSTPLGRLGMGDAGPRHPKPRVPSPYLDLLGS